MLNKISLYPNLARAVTLMNKNFETYATVLGMIVTFLIGNAVAGALALAAWGMTRNGHHAVFALAVVNGIVAIVWRFAGRFFNQLWQADDDSEQFVSLRYLVYLPWSVLFAMGGTLAMLHAIPADGVIIELGYNLPNLNIGSMFLGATMIGSALAGTAAADTVLQFFRFRWTK